MWLLLSHIAATTTPVVSTGATPLVLVISVAVGAIFGTGGLYAFFKLRNENKKLAAEARKINIEAESNPITLAQGAVVVQSGVIKDLQQDLQRQDVKIQELERMVGKREQELATLELKCQDLQTHFYNALQTLDRLHDEHSKLKDALEQAQQLRLPPAS